MTVYIMAGSSAGTYGVFVNESNGRGGWGDKKVDMQKEHCIM